MSDDKDDHAHQHNDALASINLSFSVRFLFLIFDEKIPQKAQHERLDTENSHDSSSDTDELIHQRLFNVQMKIRAVFGEFMGTFCFFLVVFSAIANAYVSGWDNASTSIGVGLAAGVMLVAQILSFSGISGANFNPVVSLALWATRKQSTRICIFYIIAQLLASIAAVGAVAASYTSPSDDLFNSLAVTPRDDASSECVFFSELFSTFILVYVIFTIAFEESEAPDAIARIKRDPRSMRFCDSNGLLLYSSSPSSRGGFAPFAIGFAVLGLAFYGGASGAAMNPARMLGPAIISGKWDKFYIYMLGEIAGALIAGFLVVFVQNLPLRQTLLGQPCGPDDNSCKRIDTACRDGTCIASMNNTNGPLLCHGNNVTINEDNTL